MNNLPNMNFNSNYYPQMYHEDGLLQVLLNGIKGEAAAVDFYSRLANMAVNEQHRNKILKIVEDEREHLQSFINLFYTLTNRQPQYQIERVAFNTFEEGLQEAIEDELTDYETYRNQYLKTRNQMIRDIFLRAFTDEIKHATIFNNIASSVSKKANPNTPVEEAIAQESIPKITKEIKDYGPEPLVVDIEQLTKKNDTFRTAIWTGEHLQLTLMSIDVGGEVGLEIHPKTDQFLRIEEGQGIVRMGKNRNQYDFEEDVYDDDVILVPAGTWHNVINTGDKPLKIYSIYAPPHHPRGTVHKTKRDAMEDEHR